jgi:hypothetical protein
MVTMNVRQAMNSSARVPATLSFSNSVILCVSDRPEMKMEKVMKTKSAVYAADTFAVDP